MVRIEGVNDELVEEEGGETKWRFRVYKFVCLANVFVYLLGFYFSIFICFFDIRNYGPYCPTDPWLAIIKYKLLCVIIVERR